MKQADYAKLPAEQRSLALVKALEADEAGWAGAGTQLLNAEELEYSSTASRAPASPAASTGIAISRAIGSASARPRAEGADAEPDDHGGG